MSFCKVLFKVDHVPIPTTKRVYVNQHKNCQIMFWPSSVAFACCWWLWMLMDVDDACQRWGLLPLSGWLLFVLLSFINLLLMLVVCHIHCPCAAVVHGKIPLRVQCNDAVCKPSYLHYPQWLIVVCDTLLHVIVCCCCFVTCCCCSMFIMLF